MFSPSIQKQASPDDVELVICLKPGKGVKLLGLPRNRDMKCRGRSHSLINGLVQEGVGPSLTNREVCAGLTR